MKKLYKKIVSLVMSALLAVMVLPVTTHASNQQDNDIVYGADIGWLSQMENQGIQYLNEDGNVDDALSVLKNKGINAVRLRVFVNPETDFVWTKPDGTTCLLGYCDTQGLLYTAQRAKNLGMKIMLVFHYSDHFADPLCQDIPEQWSGASAKEIEKYVYDYTYYIMNFLGENGITPEWVQVGNEVSYGVLYPYGSNQTGDFEQLTAFLNSGYDAVKAVSPNSKVVTHLTHGSGILHFEWFFSNFITKCGGKTDVVGLSYYPYWTGGDEIENVAVNLYNMATKYEKEVMICETGEVETDAAKTYELLRKEINALNTVLICTLFTGQTSKEGIFMRYSYEFKLLCVDLYKSGIYPDTPNGTTDERFKKNVREWARMVDSNGPEVLKHKVFNKVWSPEEKLSLVSQVIAGKSRTDVALKAGINPGMLYQWVQKYKTIGYNGLVESRKGRPPQISDMKKSTNPSPLTESEREELIRLRAENEYIKAENEVIKKRIALRQEKWAAQLKAKKQQLSKNLEKRDTN